MRNRTLPTLVCLLLLAAVTAAAQARPARRTPAPLRSARQLLVVTTRDWDAVGGVLRRFERGSTRGSWAQVGAEVPIVVGRTGLAWGVGVVPVGAAAGPRKKEGDGKAPAGVFRLGSAFGFAPAREAAWMMVPYLPLTSSTECVDDSASGYYNRVVNRDSVKTVDWNSSERMRTVEGYRWGLMVEHNAAPPVAGLGSCIFLHVWAGPDKGTAGCTAMDGANMDLHAGVIGA
jgi:D-alanyl-D-alanine dipeptidase